MARNLTDSELGRHLLTIRGIQWISGTDGDPYGLILRAGSDDLDVLHERVRELGTLHRSNAGAWVTANHALAWEILRHPQLSLRHPGLDGPQQHLFQDVWSDPLVCHVVPLDDAFLTLSPSQYDRLEHRFAEALSPKALDRFRVVFEQTFNRVLDDLHGDFNLMAEFAVPVATAAAARLLGVPAAEHDHFAKLCSGLGVALDAGLVPPTLKSTIELLDAIEGVRELLTELIRAKTAAPGDDLISDLVRTTGNNSELSDDVLATATLMTVAGVELTANLVCNTIAALLDHPSQWQLLLDDPDLAAAAVDETLRYDPPARVESRIAHKDLELAGHSVASGSQVAVLVGAANHDPDVYPDPDRFLLKRQSEAELLTLGSYPTRIVASLVRLSAELAVRALAQRLPQLRYRAEVLRRLRSPVVRGVLRFPVSA